MTPEALIARQKFWLYGRRPTGSNLKIFNSKMAPVTRSASRRVTRSMAAKKKVVTKSPPAGKPKGKKKKPVRRAPVEPERSEEEDSVDEERRGRCNTCNQVDYYNAVCDDCRGLVDSDEGICNLSYTGSMSSELDEFYSSG